MTELEEGEIPVETVPSGPSSIPRPPSGRLGRGPLVQKESRRIRSYSPYTKAAYPAVTGAGLTVADALRLAVDLVDANLLGAQLPGCERVTFSPLRSIGTLGSA